MHRNDFFCGRSVLVIGGSGFLGRHVARRAAECGARVTVLSRSVPTLIHPTVVARRGDASDAAQVASAFAAAAPDVVYHLTSDSMGGREAELIASSIQNDVVATLNVLLEANRRGTSRVVMTATMEEPIGEVRAAIPPSPYAAAKSMTAGYARMMATLYGLPVVVLRVMMAYGPGQKAYKVLPATIAALLGGRPVPLASGARLVDWVYVDDVAEAFMRAGACAYPGAMSIDIGSGRLVSLRECLTIVGDLLGRPDLLRFGTLADRPLESVSVADVEPAARLLEWTSVTNLPDGLARTVEASRSALGTSQ